jgi:hypothetical protein
VRAEVSSAGYARYLGAYAALRDLVGPRQDLP